MSLRDPGHDSRGFILTINGGSSSLKCSLFDVGSPLTRVVSCKVDRIGFPEGTLTLTDVAGGASERRTIHAAPPFSPVFARLCRQNCEYFLAGC